MTDSNQGELTRSKCDPEAAYAIFSNSVLAAKTTLIPLDLTHQVLGNEEVLKLLRYGPQADMAPLSSPSTVRQLFLEIISYFAATYEMKFAMTDGPPLHDPVAVAAVFAPEMFDDLDGERFEICVVRGGDDNALDQRRSTGRGGECGRTVLKLLAKGAAGVRVPRTLNVGEFWHLIDLALQSVPK
jgi:uridine nucleosidase